MNSLPSSLYNEAIQNLEERLHSAIDNGLADGNGKSVIFFRADDIGVPSKMFTEMISLFLKYRIPLNLAAVPAWLTESRLHSLQHATGKSSLFCWHQHGWIHKNHESIGKKQEFGESRSAEELHHDLLRGKKRLSKILGNDFYPVFTPPWNRCGQTTLNILEDIEFKAISRSSGAAPPVSSKLLDIQVNVDLHTRKEKAPQASVERLLFELRSSIRTGTSGIMLHHQRMNLQALYFLEQLLRSLSSFQEIQPLHFQDILAESAH